jgi:uncharacterized protein YpiB (UPF0302 family)
MLAEDAITAAIKDYKSKQLLKDIAAAVTAEDNAKSAAA